MGHRLAHETASGRTVIGEQRAALDQALRG